MDFLLDHKSLCEAFRQAAAGAVSVRVLAAWATCGAGIDCLRECRAGYKRAIIGTTFAVTEPEALHRLMRHGFDLRVVDRLPNGGTFHPKAYLFEQPDGSFIAMLGSANLTDAAFARNAEVMVRATLQAPSASKLLVHFEDYWDSGFAKPVSNEWFHEYTERYRTAMLSRERDLAQAERERGHTRKSGRVTPQTSDVHDLMQSDWSEYVRRLSNRKDMPDDYLDGRDDSYLQALSVATPLLRSGFATADQKSVARIMGRLDCGWLGTVHLMRGRGAKIYNDADLRGLVDDCIRPLWNVTSDSECLSGAREVFRRLRAIDGFGPGFITRILAIARPDRFYSCNDASCSGLASLFGVAKSNLGDWEGYEEGLNVVYSTRWYTSPEPANARMKRLWNARVALLDAYAYQALEG